MIKINSTISFYTHYAYIIYSIGPICIIYNIFMFLDFLPHSLSPSPHSEVIVPIWIVYLIKKKWICIFHPKQTNISSSLQKASRRKKYKELNTIVHKDAPQLLEYFQSYLIVCYNKSTCLNLCVLGNIFLQYFVLLAETDHMNMVKAIINIYIMS